MKLCIWVCMCFIRSAFSINPLLDLNLINCITNILEYKNVKFVHLYTCVNVRDKVRISKALNQNNIRHSFIHSVEQPNLNYLGYVFDVSCQNLGKILKKSQNKNLFQSRFKWILFDSQRSTLVNSSSIKSSLIDIQFRLDSEVLVALVGDNPTKILVYDVYSVGKGDFVETKVIEVGFWTLSLNLTITYRQSKYQQRKNLTGTFIKVGTVNTQPLLNKTLDLHYRNLAKNDADNLNKVNYMLFIHIQEIHNFTYSMTAANKWFGNTVGGVDDGLGRLLYENIVDIGATSGSIRSDRVKLFDFVFPTYPFRTCFIFRMPRSTGQINNEFLKPFVYSLWYLILATIVVFCIVLKLLFCTECKISGRSQYNSWHSAWILTMGVLCQQGASFVPKPMSGRWTLMSMLIMSLLLYNYYTSSIVSSLLLGLPTPFKTITELTESQLNVGLEDIAYTRTWFQIANNTDLNKFYKKKVLVNNVPSYVSVSEGIKRVKVGGYAYHTEANTAYTIIKTEFEPYQICELGEVNLLPSQVLWLVSKKNSEYSKMLAVGYNQMLQCGIVTRQQSIWMTKKPACLANTHLIQVGIQHLLPAFFILGFGAGLAFLMLGIEVLRQKKTNKT